MKAGEDKGVAIHHPIEQRIGKSPQQNAPHIGQYDRRLQRRFSDPLNLTIDLCNKGIAKACAAGGVPIARFDNIEARGGKE